MPEHKGGCLCGKVRFVLSEDPEVAYGCHCRFCQKATGTAFRSGMRYRKENVSINVKIDGVECGVPLDPNNRHYAEILKQVEEKKLTIKEAEE